MPSNRKMKLRYFRKIFLQSTDVLEVIDKGSGSQHFKSGSRNVKDIAKYAGMPWHKTKLINKIISYLNIETALELGTSVGLGSLAMAVNHTKSIIETVEACPNTSAYAINKFKELDLENIRVFNYDFSFFLNNISQYKAYDLIYIDGHHNKESTLEYFDLIQKHIHEYSLVILDDIYWSKGMQAAWQIICKQENVKVSIDLYFWGIIFFNPDLSKQHYKIRCFF